MELRIIFGYFVTGIIWGATNALMELGSKKDESKTTSTELEGTEKKNTISSEVVEGVTMFTRMKFLLPFLLNQAASILNNFLVAKSDLSIAVPVVNCITFQVTFISRGLLKGTSLIDVKFFVGSVLIMLGLYLCLTK